MDVLSDECIKQTRHIVASNTREHWIKTLVNNMVANIDILDIVGIFVCVDICLFVSFFLSFFLSFFFFYHRISLITINAEDST